MRALTSFFFWTVILLVHSACTAQTPHNALTDEEIEDGWELLFDGESFDGWHKFGGDPVGSAWTVTNGAMTLIPGEADDWQTLHGGDIVSAREFESFELSLEWKISEGGNSGIMYLVKKTEEYDYPWQTGLEMQVLDNDRHADGRYDKHRAGDLYDLIEADTVATRPVGEWNHVRIIKDGPRVEHWLNGRQIVSFELWTDEWHALVADSKFSEMEGFGTARAGAFSLQDHGDWVAYRNVKVRPL